MDGLFSTSSEYLIAIMVYLGGSAIILWCWYWIVQRLPKPWGGMAWLICFAILLTPTVSEGNNAALAPAIFGLIFGVLTKETALVWSNLANILMVIGVGVVAGYFAYKYLANQSKTEQKNSPL